jgi:hypothetical protein
MEHGRLRDRSVTHVGFNGLGGLWLIFKSRRCWILAGYSVVVTGNPDVPFMSMGQMEWFREEWK